jgi:hypothetical protein
MGKLEERVASVEALPWGTPPQALDKTVRALECMTLIQENNRWPYSYATIFTWILRGLVVDVAGRPYGHFLELLSGQGQNVTMEIERECKELAAAVLKDEALSRRFRQEPAQELAEGLPQDFAKRLDGFLKRYGCRSSQRTLYVKRWAEAPEEVLGIIKALVQRGSVRDHSRGDLHELRLGGGIRVIVHPVL